jgi:tagaturonate reductase
MNPAPETILQLGAGRFLRAFVDRFVQQANDAGQAVGRVVVVQSTPGGRAELLNQQPEGYHVLVRGYENGELVERTEHVGCISRALVAAGQWDQVRQLARSPQLRYVVSNATEAGYVLEPEDRADAMPPRSMPAKLTQILWWRFETAAAPLVLLPCELFEDNASKLLELVLTQARRWALPESFAGWLREQCLWLTSLVDCIVTSPPADHPLARRDRLLVCAEPYALWAIQRPAAGAAPLFRHSAIQVVDDLTPYFLRKVRILNGLHTAMVAKFLAAGFQTVRDVLAEPDAVRWLRGLLFEEIVPTLAYRVDEVAHFADQTWDRLRNPFQVHRLADIALHHPDKVRIRLEPTRQEYLRLFGKEPRRLSEVLGLTLRKHGAHTKPERQRGCPR